MNFKNFKIVIAQFFLLTLMLFAPFFRANDSLKVLKNEELFEKFQKELNPNTSLIYFKELENRKLAPEFEAKLNYRAGVMSDFLMDSNNAKKYLLKSYQIASKLNDKELLSAVTYNLGVAEYKLENFKASEKYFHEFKNLVSELPEGMKKITQLADYYTIYLLNGDFGKFIEVTEDNYQRTLAQEELNTNSQLKPAFLMTKQLFSDILLNAAVLNKDEKLAEKYFLLSNELFDRNNESFKQNLNTHQIGFHYLFKSQYFIFKKDYKNADAEIAKLYDFAKTNNFKDFIFKSLVTKANLNFKEKKFEESLKSAEEALKSKVPIIDFYNYELEAYRYAYLSAKALGKNDEVLRYSQLFIEKSDKTLNDKKQKALAKILSKEENFYIIKSLEKEKNNNQIAIYGLLILGVLVLILISLAIYNRIIYKRNYKRFQEIIQRFSEENTATASSETKTIKVQKKSSIIEGDEKTKNLLAKLSDFENGLEFLKQEMSLSYLAGFLNTNTVTLSSIINNYKESNFNDYINKLRINYIVKNLQENLGFQKYKISYLAEISGFSSHSLFTIAFKKFTGITPAQFIKFLNK